MADPKHLTTSEPTEHLTPTLAAADRPSNSAPWSCHREPSGHVRESLDPDEIRKALESGTGTLWVDIDRDHPEQVALLREVFRFHPLAIEDSLNPESRV